MHHHPEANRRAILAMTASMACFTLNDTVMKLASAHLPVGEMIVIRNSMATAAALAFAILTGAVALPASARRDLLGWRMLGEIGSTFCFLTALVHMPIADAIAIGQSTPIAVTAAAAVFLGEPVGWRRWLAALAGFIGVLFIIRPGTGAFSLPGLLVLASVGFVVMRDLVTRGIAATVPTATLVLMSAAATGLSGFFYYPFETWTLPAARDIGLLAVAAAALTTGYMFVVIAMRTGEIATAAPFRYTSMLFGLFAGYVTWGEIPDDYSMLGIVIVVAAGLYTLHRQRLKEKGRED